MGTTEEIEKLDLKTWNKKIFFRKTNKMLWVEAIFLGQSGDSKQIFFMVSLNTSLTKKENFQSW